MVKIKITTRNFTFGDRIFGLGGVYDVEPNVAKTLVQQNKAVVIEGYIPEVEAPVSTMTNEEFVGLVKANASAIIEILESSYKAPSMEGVKLVADLSVESPKEEAVDNSDDDEASASSETESAEIEDNADASPEGREIPEDFPGREHLIAAGIETIEAIPTTKEDLMAVEGIGARLANQIGVKLALV